MPFDDKDDFDEGVLRAQKRKREADRRDFGDEQAGRSTGRLKRFLPIGNRSATDGEDRKRKDALGTVLDLLLITDPVYAAAHEAARSSLSKAEEIVQTALMEARDALAAAEDHLQSIMDNASRLENGVRVFRRSDGVIVDETGQIVSNEEAASIIWKPGSPSYEIYLRAKDAREDAKILLAELELYQIDVLGTWRDRLEDEDNPPSLEELESFQQQLLESAPEAIKPTLEEALDAPASLMAKRNPTDADEVSYQEPTARSDSISLPKI